MLRQRHESNFGNLFFGALFASAALMVAHGLGVAVVYPMFDHSEMISTIANGFAQAWIG